MASSTIEPIDAGLEHSIGVLLDCLTYLKSGQLLKDLANCQGIQCLDDFYFYYNEEVFEHKRGM
jgi:hypothetical protein